MATAMPQADNKARATVDRATRMAVSRADARASTSRTSSRSLMRSNEPPPRAMDASSSSSATQRVWSDGRPSNTARRRPDYSSACGISSRTIRR